MYIVQLEGLGPIVEMNKTSKSSWKHYVKSVISDQCMRSLQDLSGLYPIGLSNILESSYVPDNVCEDFERQSQKLIYRLHETRNILLV